MTSTTVGRLFALFLFLIAAEFSCAGELAEARWKWNNGDSVGLLVEKDCLNLLEIKFMGRSFTYRPEHGEAFCGLNLTRPDFDYGVNLDLENQIAVQAFSVNIPMSSWSRRREELKGNLQARFALVITTGEQQECAFKIDVSREESAASGADETPDEQEYECENVEKGTRRGGANGTSEKGV